MSKGTKRRPWGSNGAGSIWWWTIRIPLSNRSNRCILVLPRNSPRVWVGWRTMRQFLGGMLTSKQVLIWYWYLKTRKNPNRILRRKCFMTKYKEYLSTFSDWPVTWVSKMQGSTPKYDGAMLMVLLNVYHWRLVRLNKTYAWFYVMTQPPVIERPLYMYMNLIKSQWVEEIYYELLWTVP